MPWNLQFALTEGDRRCLPVAPYWSKRLTVALGITRWQTVVLLLSMLRIQYNIGHGKFVLLVSLIVLLVVAAIFVAVHTDGRSKVSFHFKWCLLVSTALNRSSVNLVEPDSSSARVFANSALLTDCRNNSLSAKYKHMQTALIYSNTKKIIFNTF